VALNGELSLKSILDIIFDMVAVRMVDMKRMVRSGFILVIHPCLLISSYWMVMMGAAQILAWVVLSASRVYL
jgi:hypothetical protein